MVTVMLVLMMTVVVMHGGSKPYLSPGTVYQQNLLDTNTCMYFPSLDQIYTKQNFDKVVFYMGHQDILRYLFVSQCERQGIAGRN
jgi:hypothetical protein